MNKKYRERIDDLKNKNPFISQTQIAYHIICDSIVMGEMKMGEKINQEYMADALSMSRSPLRDAMIRLEEEGYLTKSEKAGYEVSHLQLKDYIDFCEMRVSLETMAAYRAARYITMAQMKELKNNVKKFAEVCEKDDRHMCIELDNQFHKLIVEASDNTYLIHIYNTMMNKRKMYINRVMTREVYDTAYKKHCAIYEAIYNHDEEKAEAAMRSHISFYMKNIIKVLGEE